MKKAAEKFTSLTQASQHFGLPVSYLEALAKAGRIPSLVVNSRLRFNLVAVQAALDEIANGGCTDD